LFLHLPYLPTWHLVNPDAISAKKLGWGAAGALGLGVSKELWDLIP